MNDQLWMEAEHLASRNYQITFERDLLSNGQPVYMARNPNLPGCKAQGATVDEAKSNLDEVRIDYIYALLEEGLPVPEPRQPIVEQSNNVTIRTFLFNEDEDTTINDVFDQVTQPDQREYMYGLTLGGDLVQEA